MWSAPSIKSRGTPTDPSGETPSDEQCNLFSMVPGTVSEFTVSIITPKYLCVLLETYVLWFLRLKIPET